MDLEVREGIAFICHLGLFQFKVIPVWCYLFCVPGRHHNFLQVLWTIFLWISCPLQSAGLSVNMKQSKLFRSFLIFFWDMCLPLEFLFTFVTDHACLLWVFKTTKPSTRIIRWIFRNSLSLWNTGKESTTLCQIPSHKPQQEISPSYLFVIPSCLPPRTIKRASHLHWGPVEKAAGRLWMPSPVSKGCGKWQSHHRLKYLIHHNEGSHLPCHSSIQEH